ncbi:MAG: tetratricopeptide repeat protein, partial [Salibacteraceae bacterium]
MILTRFFFIFLFTTGAICLSAKETNEIAEQQLRSISEKIAFPDSAFNMLAVINVNTLSDSLLAEYYRLKGSAYFYKGLADSSIVYFTSAFAQTDSGNCDHQFSKVTNGLAVVLQNSELYEEAIDYYLMALACADQREDYSLKLKVLSNLSILCRETGNIHQGRAYLDQAFELSEQLKDQPGLAFLYNSKGQFFVAEKQYDSAKVAFNQSLIYRGDDDLKGRATSLT